MDKILSVITNFGCDTGCKYCIWKEHSLKSFKTTTENTDWDKLKQSIEHYSPNQISVSGGGDPLFQCELNDEWWNNLFNICKDTKVEIHTSKFLPKWKHLNKLNRYVLHMEVTDYISIRESLKDFAQKNKLRIVVVLNESATLEDYTCLSVFCRNNNIELSVRQLVVDGKEQYILHEEMKEGHKQKYWYYIEQADYNLYYMPDNKIYNTYQF